MDLDEARTVKTQLGQYVDELLGDRVHALSNHHVLVGAAGRAGDDVLQPGPADGRRLPVDRVGCVAGYAALTRGEVATVDAALALLDDPVVDPAYPAGALTGAVAAEGGEPVEKVGRTTGITQGRVTASALCGQ